jgi:hypothetical protein
MSTDKLAVIYCFFYLFVRYSGEPHSNTPFGHIEILSLHGAHP